MKKRSRFRLAFPSREASCDISIGRGLLSEVPDILARCRLAEKYLLLTDSKVGKLYGDSLFRSLQKKGIRCGKMIIPRGERSKSREMKERVEDRMLGERFARDAAILTLGGGVVGDLGGFVASTFLRGIPYIQMPTTLLSMADSSVGGKTAVDHPLGKNLIGSFHQPAAVWMDVGTLLTLPKREFRCGMAEVIKYGAALDASLFRKIEKNAGALKSLDLDILHDIVVRCARLKGKIVRKDEREQGLRKILNFGHTIAHSLEILSSYRIHHGEAVSIGMAVESGISRKMGLLDDASLERIVHLLRSFSLPVRIPSIFSPEDIVEATGRDKKVRKGNVEYVLIARIGTSADPRKIAIPVSDKLVLQSLRSPAALY